MTPLIKHYKNLLDEVNKCKYEDYSAKEYDRKAKASDIRIKLLKLKFGIRRRRTYVMCA